MIRHRIDPFLLNFITLGIIIGLLALTLISVYQRAEIAEKLTRQEEFIAKQDNVRLHDVLKEIIVNQNLTKKVLQEQIDQLVPARATEERQIQAEEDHFNQTATILESIRQSSNDTRAQVENLNQTN